MTDLHINYTMDTKFDEILQDHHSETKRTAHITKNFRFFRVMRDKIVCGS